MKSIALALTLALTVQTPAQAKACHRYSHWAYPWAQRCGVGQKLPSVRNAVANRPSTVASRFATPDELPNFGIDMPLPGLARADVEGGEADDEAKGRLLLKAALEAPDAH
jgi:hypothetical protein